jgi:CRP/FNR family transcriptional regulator, cyclic AMP receptor protein
MKSMKYKPGDTILTEGEDGDTAFLIADGSVEVSVGAGTKAKTVGTLKSGEVFGEMSLIEPGPRSATVKAVTDTECIVTNYEEFIASLQDDPERGVEFMKTLVRRLRQMNDRVASMNPTKRGLRAFFKDLEDSFDPNKVDERRVDLLFWPMV